MPDPGLDRLALGITLFRPSRDQVDRVLAHAASGSTRVIAFDDGGLADADAERLARAGVAVLSAGRNVGIAEALNRIAASAGGRRRRGPAARPGCRAAAGWPRRCSPLRDRLRRPRISVAV
ncbi:hypothetical protein [Methylobacterium sp. WL1]|uniref:hypothetical protein n=1 Tax=Methylobacterium sp. WL1 TaxID=2603276 RepID=UPI001FEEEBD6|nr:hypothetical protein [Methylobacterium sp. WL1]